VHQIVLLQHDVRMCSTLENVNKYSVLLLFTTAVYQPMTKS